MNIKLKPLGEQVLVITGASSGIGLTTAKLAAKQGAKLVLAARNEDALRQLVQEIQREGGQATFVVADVGKEEDVRDIERATLENFGGYDTWINNAGVGIYGEPSFVVWRCWQRVGWRARRPVAIVDLCTFVLGASHGSGTLSDLFERSFGRIRNGTGVVAIYRKGSSRFTFGVISSGSSG